ncbi:pilin [Patescibacteria group bacterium]|nr:pilin [Patescibacteria group bacterium]MBU2259777.1 pilin [Patescibacteria group bacterium]
MSLRLIHIGILLCTFFAFVPVSFAYMYLDCAECSKSHYEPGECGIKEGLCPVNRHKVKQHYDPFELLEPLGSQTDVTIPAGGGSPLQPFLELSSDRMPWFILVAVGLVTLWVLVSGGMIIVFGGDQSGRSKWIEHIKWAIIGLIALVFVGVILNFLNASFYI